ncbi:MAG TPA: hypothetical protein VE685_13100 [Thermoanaerobaculia bacterium]|nr:hypothetical protein [Thermoanaerobaculia bacterium]
MFRKLFVIAALMGATAATTTPPVPAIDFICSCTVCSGGSGPGCRDTRTGRFTSCSSWWATYSSTCR